MSARPKCGKDCLEFLGEEFKRLDDRNPCQRSAERGHLACLRYAHEHGCRWYEETCSDASDGGHLDCLRYAHENGCPWDERTCWYACMDDDYLECLRYAHERGCPWSARTCWYASAYGNPECLDYALENGCPPSDFTDDEVHPYVVPYLYHRARGVRLLPSDANYHLFRDHCREHVRKAWNILRCATALLGAYRRACVSVYSPDGVGYREAEISFREAVGRQDGITTASEVGVG